MTIRWTTPAFAFVLLALPHVLSGQAFEGVVKQRTIEVDENGLYDLLYGEADEEPEFESEEEWLRYSLDKLAAIPVERLASGNVDGADVETITTYVKGGKVRSEVTGSAGQGYVIYDVASGTTWMVNPADRSYIRYTLEEVEAATKEAQKQAEEALAKMGIDMEEIEQRAEEMDAQEMDEEMEVGVTVTSLGKTQEINGILASGYEAHTDEGMAVGWCAQDDQGIMETMKELMQLSGFEEDEDDSGPSMDELLCKDRLPVLVQTFTPGGFGVSFSVEEILSIERTGVSDEQFVIPEGYTEKSLRDMWEMEP